MRAGAIGYRAHAEGVLATYAPELLGGVENSLLELRVRPPRHLAPSLDIYNSDAV
jgi:hypothetical protein